MRFRGSRIKTAALVASTAILITLSAATLKLTKLSLRSSRPTAVKQRRKLTSASKFKSRITLSESVFPGRTSARYGKLIEILRAGSNVTESKEIKEVVYGNRKYSGTLVESCYGLPSCYFEVKLGEPILKTEFVGSLFRLDSISELAVEKTDGAYVLMHVRFPHNIYLVGPDAGVSYASVPMVGSFTTYFTGDPKRIGIAFRCDPKSDTICSSIQIAKPF